MRGFVVVLFIVFGLFVRWNIWGFLLGVRTDIGATLNNVAYRCPSILRL
jgi:hypothetical protein